MKYVDFNNFIKLIAKKELTANGQKFNFRYGSSWQTCELESRVDQKALFALQLWWQKM